METGESNGRGLRIKGQGLLIIIIIASSKGLVNKTKAELKY